jgi:outer membrane protein TolC
VKQSLELLKQMESVMLSAYTAAVGSQSGLLKLQVKMVRVENKIISLKEEGKIIRFKLEELLNTKAALQFPYPKELPELKTLENISEIKKITLKNNTEVLMQKGEVKVAKTGVYAAEQIYSPDFVITASYTSPKFKGTRFVNSGESGEWSAMVSLSLPIWYKNSKAKANEAKQRLAAETKKLRKEESVAVRKVMVLNVKLEDMERQIGLFHGIGDGGALLRYCLKPYFLYNTSPSLIILEIEEGFTAK